MEPSPIELHPLVTEEDRARSEFYALLGRLYGGPPDAALLSVIGASETWPEDGDDALASGWNRLVLASRAMDAEAAEQEYTDLFIGVGRCECDLHAAAWRRDIGLSQPRVAIRAELASLGLGRQGGSTVYEDHLAALCETMRILVSGGAGRKPVDVATQRAFFARHLEPWVFACCNAIRESSVANYYVRVAEFTHQFMAIERDSLAIE